MDVRRIWRSRGRRRPLIAVISAVILGAAMWLVWEGPLMALSSPDIAEWKGWIGESTEGLDSLCRGGFERGGSDDELYCDELRHSLPIAEAEATSATVTVDEKSGRVTLLGFRIEPFFPSFDTTPEGMVRLTTFSEMVRTHLEVDACEPMEISYREFEGFRCDEHLVIHSGTMAEARGRLSVELWIGRTLEDMEPAVDDRGEMEHRRRAYQLRRAAEEYEALGHDRWATMKLEEADRLEQAGR